MTNNFEPALSDTISEMERQDDKWGEQNHPFGTKDRGSSPRAYAAKRATDEASRTGKLTWRLIIDEEVMEAYDEDETTVEGLQNLYDELTQVAGVAIQAANSAKRRMQEMLSDG